MANLEFKYYPYNLQLEHTFTVSAHSRAITPVMITELHYEDLVGYGEAAMPPYLGESQETASRIFKSLDLSQFSDPFQMEDILGYVDKIAPENYAAKAAIDIALHDLVGKMLNQPWFKIWGYNADDTPVTSFTIGIDKPEIVKEKALKASPYKLLKVKVGLDNDQEMIETIRSVSDTPICVDANQGWKDREKALDEILWLKEQGVVLVEQPMAKERKDDIAWLSSRSPLPIIADEAIQRLDDVIETKDIYSGINVKLMKATGMREAHKMLLLAKSIGMKTMLGCMTETSCGISAATQLSSLADWADLDGNLLITNDIFDGVKVVNGKMQLNNRPGIGVIKI
ncbi:L-alanine-DL-glutamate epimerase-like enolase superfamily enzyme [Balneicella halophila]|uniref:Dipeptide epimerase n=1 Tax=Balneicella halophila TaxID=1537566 RepID=A0A7L4URP7_BALHA|nr:dipeptide epimerase [Balneicella halophila]PVX52329.1 L-alanine-DL-glutamate epimerase-like enolase superfamily enzyme [Balneicella halophila]